MTKFKIGTLSLAAAFLLVLPLSAIPTPLIDGQQILQERLTLYRQAFPDIRFIHAIGGNNWQQEYAHIAWLLGKQPDALDYEHPPEISDDLMIVTMHRLALMLRENAISETLFRADKRSSLKGSLVCVITIDPDQIVGNPLSATSYMLGLPDTTIAKIHPDRRLDPRDFLLFAIDHEAYHCLDSVFFGGAPMTAKIYGGEYNQYQREISADAFSLAMHRRLAERPSSFTRNIMLVRSLWFLDGGPSYRTYPSLAEVQSTPLDELKSMTMNELVKFADSVRNKTSEGYKDFLDHQAVALQAAEKLGFNPKDYGPPWSDLAKRKTRSQQVNDAAKYYLDLYGRLFDDAPISFSFSQSTH